jgi:GAF domain-containing protein
MSAGLVAVTGAGITVMTGDDGTLMTVCSSDRVAHVVEDLQFTLGEGPCVDAYSQNRPVSEPDLANAPAGRWPGFTPAALNAGAAAVFGFPLRAGGVRVGALNLYRDRPGALGDEQFADALVVADVVAHEILTLQADAQTDGVAVGLVGDPGLRLVVHQASGMIAAQLDVDVREALIRLRARAYADDAPITLVATAVVERKLRFERNIPEPPPAGLDRSH